MPKNTTQCPRPALERGPLDPDVGTLTMTSSRLHRKRVVIVTFFLILQLTFFVVVTLTAARPKFNWPREDGDRNQKTGKLASWRISLNEKCKSGNLVLGWGGGGVLYPVAVGRR